LHSTFAFGLGTFLIGFGAGLFGHGTLTATMNRAPADQRGLALGAWGAVQASAAGLAVACSGVVRDVAAGAAGSSPLFAEIGAAASGYMTVYAIEVVLLVATVMAMTPLLRATGHSSAGLHRAAMPAVEVLERSVLETKAT
jgi:BCD family chlorophyll transporter-like MFS transporter